MLLGAVAQAEESPTAPEKAAADEQTIEIPSRSNGPPSEIPGSPGGGEGPGLDALLQLPSGFMSPQSPGVAGAGEGEWRRRFQKTQKELIEARSKLEETKRELDEVAVGGGSSQWSMAPPGASNSGGSSASPLSFRLRQQLKEDRDALDAAERAMRELRIEADLAGVPSTWRLPE
jgi:hypothetical protein